MFTLDFAEQKINLAELFKNQRKIEEKIISLIKSWIKK